MEEIDLEIRFAADHDSTSLFALVYLQVLDLELSNSHSSMEHS
jgi:hypothetical protein